MDEELFWAPARVLRQKFVARTLSPLEFARATLDRIELLDGGLNSFITVDPDDVLDQARRAEIASVDPERCGPLFGVPLSIKDSIATRGLRTTWGSAIYEDFLPAHDDVCVERLRAAGAIILGKTNVPEFQMLGRTINRMMPETRNPWDKDRTAGGSSGGSAASVAAGLNALSLGGDDGGSVRLPAAICGLFGYLPTAGRVPRLVVDRGAGYRGWPHQNMGPLSRDVGDGALMTAIISGFHPSDPFGRRDRLELDMEAGTKLSLNAAWIRFAGGADNPAVLAHVRRFAEGLGQAGILLDDAELEWEPGHSPALMMSYIGRFLRDIAADPKRRSQITPFTESMLATFESHPPGAEEEQQAYARRRADVQRFATFFERHDLLLCPTYGDVAPLITEGYGPPVPTQRWAAATASINEFGLPAASVPCGFVDGLPVALQIIGPRGADRRVIAAALAIEAHWPWAAARPSL